MKRFSNLDADQQEALLQLEGPQQRASAARALSRPEALDTLFLGIRSRKPAVRHACYWALAKCKGPGVYGVFPALLAGCGDTDARVADLTRQLLLHQLQAMPLASRHRLRQVPHAELQALLDELAAPQPTLVAAEV